jgi:Protein of unknown function (DUF2550)
VGGGLAFDAAGIFAAVLILILLAAVGIAVRRLALERGGGTVECALRRASAEETWLPWHLGVARYQRDELRWHRVFGVLLRPDEALARSGLVVVSRRLPDAAETVRLGAETRIVCCHESPPAAPVELAMSEAALTGFLAWLEAAPPGSTIDQIA